MDELREITTKALSTPNDILELMRHKAYMQSVMQEQMPFLQERIYVLHNQLQVTVLYLVIPEQITRNQFLDIEM